MNGAYWAHYLRRICLPQVRVLRETVFDRAIPAFSAVEAEADEIKTATWERLGAVAGPDTDPADLAEAAVEAGVDHYLMRRDAQQSLLNLFAVALHHLVEQHLLFILRKQLLPKPEENNPKHFKREVMIAEFSNHGITIPDLPRWSELEELRLVANTVKHAEGSAANQLAELRPEFFVAPSLRGTPFAEGPVGQVFAPLAGEDVYLLADELGAYFDAAEDFLEGLAARLDSLP